MKSERRKYTDYLVFVVPLAIIAGLAGSGTVALFNLALAAVQRVMLQLPRMQYLSPAAGALVVGFLILRYAPGAGGEGVPHYIVAVNLKGGKQSYLESLLRFPAAVLTLGSFGSGGIVGPLISIGSGVVGLISEKLLFPLGIRRAGGLRTAAICGASAAVGAIFHAPVAGGILAAEVLRRESLRYADLFPAILSSTAGTVASIYLFGQKAVFAVDAPPPILAPHLIAWFLLVAVVAGGVGMGFIYLFEHIARALLKLQRMQPARALIAAAVLCTIFYFTGRGALGISIELFQQIIGGRIDAIAPLPLAARGAVLALGFMLLVKAAATSITVGGGMSAGFTGPFVILGVGSGALLSIVAGIQPGEPAYSLFLACGLSATLAAAMNVPIAGILLSIELFGAGYAIPAVTGGTVAFLIFRTRSVYSIRRPPYLPESDEEEAG